ncbi:MAG: arginase family protein [Armatimonadota bacterium]
MTVRILDLDGSVTSQVRLIEHIGTGLDVVDLRDLGPAVRYLPSKKSACELESVLTSLEPAGLTFTGSGDFHHATASLLRGFEEPLSLVVMDQHSDWIGASPCPCGSWLRDVLRLPNVVRVVVIGTEARSIQGWRIVHGPVGEILSGRVELYPFSARASRCPGRRRGEIACAVVQHNLIWTELCWRTIAEADWTTLIDRIINGLPTPNVYLSIDKDCLVAEHAFTNWGNGSLTLDQVLEAVRMLAERKNLVGADITGDYSPIEVENRLMLAMARKIHPRSGDPGPDDLRRNEETNLALLEALRT